jgi:hypothetical protein
MKLSTVMYWIFTTASMGVILAIVLLYGFHVALWAFGVSQLGFPGDESGAFSSSPSRSSGGPSLFPDGPQPNPAANYTDNGKNVVGVLKRLGLCGAGLAGAVAAWLLCKRAADAVTERGFFGFALLAAVCLYFGAVLLNSAMFGWSGLPY